MLQGKQQFAVSELAAWAVMRTFASYMTDDQKQQLRVKWPNDIFYGDRKLAGILIEHSLTGSSGGKASSLIFIPIPMTE